MGSLQLEKELHVVWLPSMINFDTYDRPNKPMFTLIYLHLFTEKKKLFFFSIESETSVLPIPFFRVKWTALAMPNLPKNGHWQDLQHGCTVLLKWFWQLFSRKVISGQRLLWQVMKSSNFVNNNGYFFAWCDTNSRQRGRYLLSQMSFHVSSIDGNC